MLSVPQDVKVIRLGRINKRNELVLCEPVEFLNGYKGVELALRRARISGRVELNGEIVDHLADLLDAEGTLVETVALCSRSYSSLKNRWMRCRIDRSFSVSDVAQGEGK